MEDLEVYSAAALMGALAGMRSMAGPAFLGQLARKGALSEVTGPLAVVTKSGFAPTSGVLALGEMVADKLPFMPNRTAMGPMLGRALTGGLSGAVICSAKRRPMWIGALIGAAAAIGAAFGAYHLRKSAGDKLHIPDGMLALGEDALVAGLGNRLTARLT